MVRRIGFIRFLLALYLSALILSPNSAAAAEIAPGDACNPAQAAHSFEWTNPTNGVSNAIFCESGTWSAVMNFQASTGNVGIANTAPGALLDVGKVGTTLGTMRLEGNTSGYVQLQPAAAAGSVTFTLPATVGSAGQQLTTDGASPATLTWAAAGGGGVTLNGITAATGNQTGIDNGAYTIVWNWDTLAGGSALKLASTSTAAASNAQKMLEIALSGTNATSAQTTYGAYISNTHDGTTSTDIGLYATASGGTTRNYGIEGVTSSTIDFVTAGVYGNATGASGVVYGVEGTSVSATGYGVFGYNSTGSGGRGVFGQADTGVAVAVEGYTGSTTAAAKGVYGIANGATGATYGVYGSDGSATGFGGYFTNFNGGYALATGSGNVGIGTTTPAQALEVNGQVKVDTFAAASATTVCQNANVLSTCSSSIRYKEKVKDAPFGLREVMLMRPVTFKWKGRDEKDLGFIAEEMEQVNPLFVNYERGQIEGVKYPQMTAVLANAIKEQQAEIESLKALNDKLKALNDNLDARVKVLEAARH